MKRHNILMNETGDVAACSSRVASACEQLGGVVVHKNRNLPIVSAFLTDEGAEQLAANPDVAVVEVDGEVRASSYDNSWGVVRVQAPDVHGSGNRGAGVKVAIIDTGSNLSHVNLVTAAHVNFIDPSASGDDDNGHGSHVHGIIAGQGEDGVTGVAPDAEIYALKALGTNGNGLFSDIIAALDWCISTGIQVINHSYGSITDPGIVVQQAYERTIAAGIINIAAAGNDGPANGTLNWPAAYIGVYAVGAVNTNNDIALFSSRGIHLNIVAPGVSITSAWIGSPTATATVSGTSMACPHVAGAAALAVVAEKSVGDINSNALDLGDPGWDNTFGMGLMQLGFLVVEPVPDTYGRHLRFDASGSFDPDGEITSYLYTFGDGHSASVVNSSWEHEYEEDGVYTVSVEVTDSDGLTDKIEQVIQVVSAPAAAPPVADLVISEVE